MPRDQAHYVKMFSQPGLTVGASLAAKGLAESDWEVALDHEWKRRRTADYVRVLMYHYGEYLPAQTVLSLMRDDISRIRMIDEWMDSTADTANSDQVK